MAIVREGHLLCFERERDGERYLVLPGGGVEAGEELEDAAVREVAEELGASVTLGEVLTEYENELSGRDETVFLAELDPDSPEPSVKEQWRVTPENQYHLVWLPFDQLAQAHIVPEQLHLALLDELGES